MHRKSGTGWRWFLAWAGVGAIGTFAVLDLPAFGPLILPFAILAFIVVTRRSRHFPEALGVLDGAGAVSLLVAFLNRGYQVCGQGPTVLRPGQTSYQCGGVDPFPWLITGIVLLSVGLVAYGAAIYRGNRAAPSAA